ncbi:MAG: AI-2E family transporter [Deltaproteobacteria bacterium]|jgi:predicted PurR-regulated permease PerM|nr:AI-2E family transporter [Deltaproteobacteria bacterium]
MYILKKLGKALGLTLGNQAPPAARSGREARPGAARARAARLGGQRKARTGLAVSIPFSTRLIFYCFLFALLFLALYLCFLLMRPFSHSIILACIFSSLLHPLYSRIRLKTGCNDYISAGITLILVVVLFCLPLTFFVSQLIPQGGRSIRELAQWLSGNHLDELFNGRILPWLTWINEHGPSFLELEVDIADMRNTLIAFSRGSAQQLLSRGTGFVVNSITLLINFLLMLLIMFFLLKDGESMVNRLKQLTPLSEEQDDNILQSLRRMSGAVLVGGFSVAALQGLVGGIGLGLVGIQPLFWGSVMAAAALVPVLGTGLVWIPAVAYLALSDRISAAVFLAIWCGFLVTSIDSVLRPLILRGNSKVSILFMFMSIFGGIKAFGPLGIIYGPLILGFVLAMLNIYSSEFSRMSSRKKESGAGAASAPRPRARVRLRWRGRAGPGKASGEYRAPS